MDILEIVLANPIDPKEIDRLISEIEADTLCNYLLIDTGIHDFVSVGVIKYFREQMQDLASHLQAYKKIAMIHPPEFNNRSDNPERYNYFTSVDEAKKWFGK